MPKKKKKKRCKITNINIESLQIFWTIPEISMQSSGKMWLIITLKAT